MSYPRGPHLVFENEFLPEVLTKMDEILSIYILRIKCSDPHIIHVLNIFMNSIRFMGSV